MVLSGMGSLEHGPALDYSACAAHEANPGLACVSFCSDGFLGV